jgi:hypothetical protein
MATKNMFLFGGNLAKIIGQKSIRKFFGEMEFCRIGPRWVARLQRVRG